MTRRKKLPNGFQVGDLVRFFHAGRPYEGRVAESASATHVFVADCGNVQKDRVALVKTRSGRAAR